MNHDDDFDARLRGVWRTSVDSVPPALARNLRPAASETHVPSRWPLGAALAAAAVLALAIGLRPHATDAPGADTVATTTTTTNLVASDDSTAVLDRNPDFYAWLASPDAEQLAME
jgi:ferric-dicitrate binding protein FerR (iron transport regulator)